MTEPFLGQIMMVGFGFAPRGWALCDGQLLPISQNQSLYSLLGNTYGGDGRTTFALPDLRGRVPIQQSPPLPLGSKGGAETVSLTAQQIGSHQHSLRGSTQSTTAGGPAGRVLGTSGGGRAGGPLIYEEPSGTSLLQPLSPESIELTGAGAGHENMQPSLTVNFIIALTGFYPSRS